MVYVPFHADWKNRPDSSTPITDVALEYIEGGIVDAHVELALKLDQAEVDGRVLTVGNTTYASMVELNSNNYPSIAATFTAANVDGRCIVRVPPGEYTVPPLRVDKSNVTLSLDGVTLTLAAGSNASLLSIGPDAMNLHVIGGRFDGNKANQTGTSHGIIFEAYTGAARVADRSNIERTEILNALTDALRIEAKRIEVKARRVQVRDAGRYGWYVSGTDCAFSDGAIGITDVGAYIDGHANWLIGNGIYSADTAGIRLTENSRYTFVTGNMVDHNETVGLKIEGATVATMDAVIDGNVFRANSNAGDGLHPEIFIKNARAVLVTGNSSALQFGSPKTSYAILFDVGVSDIFDGGNMWEPLAHTIGVYSDGTKISSKHHRLVVNAVTAADMGLTANVAADAFNRFQMSAEGVMQWGSGAATTDVTLYRAFANVLRCGHQFQAQRLVAQGTAGAGYVEWEISQTSTPSAGVDGARMFVALNGSSKHELRVRFPTGAVQVVATEP